MPAPSRDRLARPVDISTLFYGAARRVDLVVDEPGLQWTGLSGNTNRNVSGGSGSGSGGRAHGVGFMRGHDFRRPVVVGRENRTLARRSGRRGRGTVLPYWYPRTPLRDITAVVRAIERRRAQSQNDQVVETAQQENTAPAPSNVQPELEVGISTPIPTIAMKPRLSPATQVWKIMADIPNKKGTGSEFLTPQKKLLNSIEKVSEVWLEEQRKLERTPAARKAEREKKVRTLMSMR